MTEKANPSKFRPAEAFKTAGAIAYGAMEQGYVVDGATDISTQDSGIDETQFNAFNQSSTASSFDVTIDPGEAFIYGSWLAIDTSTTVTLASSTNGQTVYVGWNKDGTNDVIVGLDSAFASASGDTDKKIPLWTFDTDGSGVTSSTDERLLGRPLSVDIDGNISIPEGDIDDGANTIFDQSAGHIPSNILQFDSLTISSGDGLKNGGSVALGSSTTLDIEPFDFAGAGLSDDGSDNLELTNDSVTINGTDGINGGSASLGGSLSVGISGTLILDSDIEAVDGETIWDESNTYIPQGRLQNSSLTVSSGDGLKNGGSVSLGGSTTLDIEPVDFAGAGLSDDGTDNLELTNDTVTINTTNGLNGGSVSLGGSVSIGISGTLVLDDDLNSVDGEKIWDESNTHIPQGRLESDSLTVTAGAGLNNGGSVSLGGSTSLGINAGENLSISNDDLDVVGAPQFSSVSFDDADNDGSNWEVTEDGASGHLNFNSSGGGGTQMDLEHNGNLQIEGELTETASL
jgi:hypothetical protein